MGTKITSVPYLIQKSGFYYLTGNLDYSSNSGNAIAVNAGVNDVTIDLMGFALRNTGAAGSSIGINIPGTCNNVVIRNGAVRNFNWGIIARPDSSGCSVINVSASGNTFLGIELDGFKSNTVKDCTASNNGGGIWVYSGLIIGCVANNNTISGGYGAGIEMRGPGSIIGNVAANNRLHNFTIGFSGATAIVADRNSAFGLSPNYYVPSGVTGVQWGINAGSP